MSCSKHSCSWSTCTLCRSGRLSLSTYQQAKHRSIDWPVIQNKPIKEQDSSDVCLFNDAFDSMLEYMTVTSELCKKFHHSTFKNCLSESDLVHCQRYHSNTHWANSYYQEGTAHQDKSVNQQNDCENLSEDIRMEVEEGTYAVTVGEWGSDKQQTHVVHIAKALIESRKKSLMQEKEELQRNLRENNFFPKSNLNEASLPRPSNIHKNHTTKFDVDRNGQVQTMEKNGSFLNFADSGIQQKKLNDERKNEYMEYLAQRQKQISAYKSSLDDAYNNMVQQKQREEDKYRVHFGEAVKERGQRKKIIEFDSDEEELFQQVLQAKMRVKSADETQRVMKLNEQKRAATFDNGFSSYPLSSMFEGDSNRSNSMKAEKCKQYKKELEDQIKEKETLKMRDKLKRLGRINSDSDLNEMSNTTKAGCSVPAHPQYAVNAEDANKIFWNTNQNFSPMLHQNATMPWTNYAMSAPPIGYMAAPPVSFMSAPPVGYPTNNPFVYLPTQYSAPPANSTIPAASVQVPQTQLVGEKTVLGNFGQYITLNSSRINEADKKTIENIPRRAVNQPPGGVSHGFMGSSLCTDDIDTNRAKKLAYSEELNRQMELKKLAAKKEKDERDRYERKLDAEVAVYDPWGKGGGGAPMRNKKGEIVADLRKLRQPMAVEPLDLDYEEISPILKALSENDGTREIQQNLTDVKNTDKNHSKSLSQDNYSPATYARGAALRELKGQSNMSPREKSGQDDYKMFLKQQVEEKKKRDQELKEKMRLEEEKENQRLFEQQRKMKEDFDKEKERQRQKEEDLRRQNEELRLLAEQKRRKEDKKQKEIREDHDLFSKNEAEQANKQQNVTTRNVSPPVPAAVKDKKNNSMINNRKESTKEQTDACVDVINKSFEIQNQSSHNSVSQQEALIKQLAALRKQLQEQENKVKEDLEKNKGKHAAIVQSSSKKRAKPLTKGVLETMSKDLWNETSSNDTNNSILLSKQQQEYMREQEMRLKLLREGLEKKINNHKKPFSDEPSNQSLLQSDSKFIPINKLEKGKKLGKNQENAPNRYEKDFKEHFKSFFENDHFSNNQFDDLQQSNLENLQRFSFNDDTQAKSSDN